MDLKFIKNDKFLLVLLLFISFFMFFFKLGAPALFETDEVIYSQISREIITSGSWLTLHLFTKPWFIHPPLYMWLAAASSYIFGFTEFNIRFWNAVFAVGLLYVTYMLGRKMFRDGVGLLAAFILAATMQYILQARMAIFDVPLVFFMLLFVLCFIYWMEDKLVRYYFLAFLFMGLAILTKGLVGILLPMLILTIFLAATGKLKSLYNLKLIPGLIVMYLAGGTWFTAEAMIHGKAFTDSVFGFYTFGRYLRPIEAHYAPWYFYFFVIFFGFMPWISFFFQSVVYQWKNRGDEDNLFTIFWLVIVFVFFTLAGTKLPGYVLSFYPFAAISVAKMLSDQIHGEDSGLDTYVTRGYKTLGVLSVLLVILGVMFNVFDAPEGLEKIFISLNYTFLIIGAGGIVASIAYFRTKYSYLPVAVLVGTMIIFSAFTASYTMVILDDFKPMKAISQKINSMYTGQEMIIGYNILNKGSYKFYLDKPVIWQSDDIITLRHTVDKAGDVFLIVNTKEFPGIGEEFKRPTFVLYKSRDNMLLYKKM